MVNWIKKVKQNMMKLVNSSKQKLVHLKVKSTYQEGLKMHRIAIKFKMTKIYNKKKDKDLLNCEVHVLSF